MKTYSTIFLDIDSLTYFLFRTRHYEKKIYESLIVKGIKSLNNFEIIGISENNSKYATDFISKNRIKNINLITAKKITMSPDCNSKYYLNHLVALSKVHPEKILVVTGSDKMLETAKRTGLDTCFLSTFSIKKEDISEEFTIQKLEELNRYQEKKEKIDQQEQINYQSFYIHPKVVNVLKEKEVTLEVPYFVEEQCLSSIKEKHSTLAVTLDPIEAIFMKKVYGCSVCFVNNHSNDMIDFNPNYEMSIEQVPERLVKLLKKS